MKRILYFIFCLASFAAFAQPQNPYTVGTVTQLKAYSGTSTAIFVADSNAYFTRCSPCTANEITIFAGAAGRKWKRVVDINKVGLTNLPFINPVAPPYNADATGATDARAALQSAINAAIAAKKTLWIPGGTFSLSDSLLINGPLTITGAGAGTIYNQFMAGVIHLGNPLPLIAENYITSLRMTTNGKPAIVVKGYPVKIEGIDITGDFTGTPTAASIGLKVDSGWAFKLIHCSVNNFYDLVSMNGGVAEYSILDNQLNSPVRYGLFCRSSIPDYGDQRIAGNVIKSARYNAESAIRIEAGGGPRISDLKVNSAYFNGSPSSFNRGIDVQNNYGATIDLFVNNASIEGVTVNPIRLGGTQAFGHVMLSNIETYANSASGASIHVDGNFNNVLISNVTLNNGGSLSSSPAIRFNDVEKGAVSNVLQFGYATTVERVNSDGVRIAAYLDDLEGGGGTPETVRHNSTFSATNGTNITAYTPLTGNAFAVPMGSLDIQGNQARGIGSDNRAVTDVAQTDYKITYYSTKSISSQTTQLIVRYTDDNNGIFVLITTGNIQVYEVVGGTLTQIGSTVSSAGDQNTSENVYVLTMEGTSLSLSINGTPKLISLTIPSTLTGTKVGFTLQTNATANSFVVTDN